MVANWGEEVYADTITKLNPSTNDDADHKQAISFIDRLNDDELCSIFNRISSSSHRKSCAQVCRRWLRLEGLTCRRLTILDPLLAHSFLPRFPNLLHVEGKSLSDHELSTIARFCSNLESLVVSPPRISHFTTEDDDAAAGHGATDVGISAIAFSCRNLQRLSLKRFHGISCIAFSNIASSCETLRHLDVSYCANVTDSCLQVISQLRFLQSLHVKGCFGITDNGLEFLSTGNCGQSLRKLDLSECDRISDHGMSFLQKMSSMQVLNLAECGARITDIGGYMIASMSSLQKLNLAWLVNISDSTVLAVAENCHDLRELVLTGCELVTGHGLYSFLNHKALQAIELANCYNVYSDDVEEIAIKCSALEYLGLDRGMRQWITPATLKHIETKCRIQWL